MTSVQQKIVVRFLSLHDKIYQATDGRIGHHVPGMPPNLLLHSVGAKTGKPRTNTLTYARDGENYLIVASNGGTNRNPAWLHNLRAHPDVEINVGSRRLRVTAKVLLPDDPDYRRLWPIVNENNADRYTEYQKKTTRPLAVVVLIPR